jgi:uncharacterized protein (DUF952 family)
MTLIYKICAAAEWAAAQAPGTYAGSAHDCRDGFIHFSTAAQLSGTLAKHFAGREDLLLIAVESGGLGDALRWEPAREGDLFPHLYGELPVAAALWTRALRIGPPGRHTVPAEVLR